MRRRCALDDPVDELAEVDGLHRLLGARVGRELDQLADEIGELAQLDVGGAEQLGALGFVVGVGRGAAARCWCAAR